MDSYVKQLLTEIKEKQALLAKKHKKLAEFSQEILSDTLTHASEYEKYYQLIKGANDEKVSPGNLPFSVYSQPEISKTSQDDGDESEQIQTILNDQKKVFFRKLQVITTESISIEQITDEYARLIKDLHEYYEDLIEQVKF